MSYETEVLLCFAAGALSGVAVPLLRLVPGLRHTADVGPVSYFALGASVLPIGWTLSLFERGIGVDLLPVLAAAVGLSLSALLIAWGKVLFTRRDRYGDLLTGAAVGTVTGLVPLPTAFVAMVGAPLAGAVSAFVAGVVAVEVRRSCRCGALGTGLGVLVGFLVGAIALLVTLPLTTLVLLSLSHGVQP
ncbi:hypothetical protein [Halostreptopolyspora alba]|uniref:Uncharacterized protein n=1 Tax=Halostreptopolyspora alba TaxID=2487137 RepID=A0A3N0E8M1_9ACTN|nr:hypothetical protein EFW17_13160 [Nocardiopsaceae bacterium YIM 96095]